MKPKHPARSSDDARQYARAGGAEPHRVMPSMMPADIALIDVSSHSADTEVPPGGLRQVWRQGGPGRSSRRLKA